MEHENDAKGLSLSKYPDDGCLTTVDDGMAPPQSPHISSGRDMDDVETIVSLRTKNKLEASFEQVFKYIRKNIFISCLFSDGCQSFQRPIDPAVVVYDRATVDLDHHRRGVARQETHSHGVSADDRPATGRRHSRAADVSTECTAGECCVVFFNKFSLFLV